MIFKATILRSNPHIIREIYIDDEKTMKDLLGILEICLNWENGCIAYGSFLTVKEIVGGMSEDKISDHMRRSIKIKEIYKENCAAFLQTYPKVCLSVPMMEMSMERLTAQKRWESNFYHRYGRQEDYSKEKEENTERWEIQLELIPEEDYVIEQNSHSGDGRTNQEDAILLRHRGLQPIWQACCMADNNMIHRGMMNIGYSYVYGMGDFNKADYMVKLDEIYQRMQNPKGERKRFIMDESICQDLKFLLDEFKMEQLKDTIREMKLPIDINCRKNLLISRMEKYYNRVEFWEKVLDSLMLEEYTLLKKMCFSSSNEKPILSFHDFQGLKKYCLCFQSFGQETRFAKPFVQYLYNRLMEEGDEDLIYSKKWKQVFKVATELYIVFDRKMCTDLAQIMFGEELDPEDISDFWDKDEKWIPYDSNLMYNPNYIYYKDAYELSQSQLWKNQRTYVPDREEALDILENGLNYDEKAQEQLEEALQPLIGKYYWMNNMDSVLSVIYHLCRCDVPIEEIRGELQDVLGIMGKQKDLDYFLELVDELRCRVRRVEYRGFTQEEYENYC